MILETIHAFGHKKILCTHNTTIEITKDKHLTIKGNCILGINASKACIDLNSNLKGLIRQGNKFKIIIKVGEHTDFFYGFGHYNLTLSNEKDMVFRKSEFICDRTVLIKCTKSSSELDRMLIKHLRNQGKEFLIEFEQIDEDEE